MRAGCPVEPCLHASVTPRTFTSSQSPTGENRWTPTSSPQLRQPTASPPTARPPASAHLAVSPARREEQVRRPQSCPLGAPLRPQQARWVLAAHTKDHRALLARATPFQHGGPLSRRRSGFVQPQAGSWGVAHTTPPPLRGPNLWGWSTRLGNL